MAKNYEKYSKEELIAEIKKLKKFKKYGLVWEEDRVKEKFEADAEQGFPVLAAVSNKDIHQPNDDDGAPTHIMIEGDNYHALSVLNYTHKNKIDVIYIDPPYNTGAQDWKYNNNYVDKTDSYRHSKWISMMDNRLKIAKNLLKEDGVIIMAIDEFEIHNARHLLDYNFGENNKLGMVTILHNPKGRNQSEFFSANSEFMLLYAKNKDRARFNSVAIDEEVLAKFSEEDEQGKFRWQEYMRVRTVWSRKNKPNNYYAIYVSKDLKKISLESKDGYEAVYPKTDDGREWAWKNKSSTFVELNKNNYFIAKKENGKIKIYHQYREAQVLKNVWTNKKYHSEFNGTNLLKKILGANVFQYPKSLYLIIDILKITSKDNSIILDFFAGSGTTGHAVMALNNEDDGNRRFIVCTNNEGNIATDVCYPRLEKVMKTGYGDVAPLGGNLKYYKTTFVPAASTDGNKIKLTHKATEMLCLRESTFEKVMDKANFKIYKNNKYHTAIIWDESAIEDFKESIKNTKGKFHVYIFSLGNDVYEEEFEDIKNKVILKPIPEAILKIYRNIFQER
ncbi:MAG: site-specific DNA-methyltransferase [Hydrotalea sp.]|nr:site-specific DNA-methyltransferase [Hydrotalea sp.]